MIESVPCRRGVRARLHGACLLAALCSVALTARAGGGEVPPISAHAHHYLVPIQDGRMVYRFGSAGPGRVLDFWAAAGREWRVYWDGLLDTPRFFYPLSPVQVAAPAPPASEPPVDLVRSTEAFIDAHADFLGAGRGELAAPYAYPLGRSWVLLFQQTTPGGILIRGANLRVVLRENGQLAWVKAFLIRGVKDPEGPLLGRPEAEAAALAAAAAGSTVRSADLQVGFLANDAGSAAPIWTLGVADPDGKTSENILDARSGEVLARRAVVKHFDPAEDVFDAAGFASGFYLDPADIFLSPTITPAARYPLREVLIRDVRPAGPEPGRTELRPRTFTDLTGSFTTRVPFNPMELNASLETGVFDAKGSYVRFLWLQPTTNNAPVPVPEEDIELNYIPDLSDVKSEGEEFLFQFFRKEPGSEASKHAAWTLQCYEHSRVMLRGAHDTIHKRFMDTPTEAVFLPFLPLTVIAESQRAPILWTYEPRDVQAEIWAPMALEGRDLDPGDNVPGPTEDVVPTVLQHEVAHHIIYCVTRNWINTDDPAVSALEDGLADALVAMINDNPKIYYRRNADGFVQSSSKGFDLSVRRTGNTDFRHEKRVDIGEAFYELHGRLAHPEQAENPDPLQKAEPEAARLLLLGWLGFGKTSRTEQRLFDRTHNLFEELLLVDDLVFKEGDGKPENGTPHSEVISKAFRGRSLFDAPFQRGDPNQDGRMDLSDAVFILKFLFLGGGPLHDCLNSLDADNNSEVEVTDAVRILGHLFLGMGPLPEPFQRCGLDPERLGSDGNLGCAERWCPF